MNKDIQIRPCQADDVDAAIPLIYSTGPQTFDYIFADTAMQQTPNFLCYAFHKGGSELGYQNHFALLYQNQLVGIAAIWSSASSLGFTLHGAVQIVRHYGLVAGLRVITRALRMEKIVQSPNSEVAYIGHLAIADDFQGRGLGVILHDYLQELEISINKGILALDVSARNPNAQRLYERLDYKVIRVNPGDLVSKFGDVIEHRYMEKRLRLNKPD